MRFGTFVPQGWKGDQDGVPVEEQWGRILQTARLIEGAGYDSIWVYDHFHTHPVVKQESTFEAWTLMAALAAVTERARLGQMCTCALYRPPSMLAKMAANVDVISGGRLDVGIGAGWSRKEFEAYGYPYPSDGERLDMLEEAVQVLKAMWTEDEATFIGKHYGVEGAINRPKPLQQPHPPLWIAGGGEKRTLRIVAEYGDFSNFGDDLDDFRHKSEILQGHCETVGRDFGEIGRSCHRMSVIGRDDADLRQKLEVAGRRRACTPDEFAGEHFAATVGQAVEEMGRFIDAGCVEMILYFYDMGEGDSMELFASEVIPQFR
jgi:F420-dependent oxidoreductase-like protein